MKPTGWKSFLRVGDSKRLTVVCREARKAGHSVFRDSFQAKAVAAGGELVFRAVNTGRCWAISYGTQYYAEPPITGPATPTGFAAHIKTHPSP